MKRYLFVTAILLATGLHATAQTPEQLWESANTAYINENYQEAVKDYESIRAQGYESDQLYLNLGNAYFKRGMTGKAIVNYNRALRLSPSDEDVLYNLGIANTYVLFIMTAIFAGAQRKILMRPNGAIIMSNAAPVKSSPDRSSKDIFVLHEGTKVTVKDSLGDFREIIISDGNKGWIEASAIEMID